MPRKKRRSIWQWFADLGRSYKQGMVQPSTDLSAKINVGVWSVLLLSTMTHVTTNVLLQNWGAVLWVNGFWALVQAGALRWALHGRLYRKEVRAKEAEEAKFLEVLKGGYGIK